MKIRKYFVLLIVCAICFGFFSCQHSSGTGNGTADTSGDTTNTGGSVITGLYRDSGFTCATWADLASGSVADCAIGDWDSTVSVGVMNGVATMTVLPVAATKSFSGGTLAQVPTQADSTSYFNFTGVNAIKFYIKSADLAPSAIKFTLQNTAGTNMIDGVSLTSYGVTSVTDWTEVVVPVSAYASQKIKVAFALFLGTNAGTSVQVKQIGFLDSAGKNVDIASTVTWPETAASIKARMTLAWSDEFNGSSTAPDSTVWNYDTGGDGWGNGELETYTDSRTNSYVSSGTLKIKAVKDGSGNWTSARMVTKGKKDFTYGYVEYKAKLPASAGTWPALWMLPTNQTYGTVYWPDNGEIDVMEASTNCWGVGNVRGTVHRNAGSGANGASGANETIGTATSDFHLYAVYWTSDKIVWFYDGVKQGEYLESGGTGWSWWPFDKNFHVIMNLAMGGTLGGSIDSSLTSEIMEVDYVRVYQ